jgi:hypothetical protein
MQNSKLISENEELKESGMIECRKINFLNNSLICLFIIDVGNSNLFSQSFIYVVSQNQICVNLKFIN